MKTEKFVTTAIRFLSAILVLVYVPILHVCLRIIPCSKGVVFATDEMVLHGEPIQCFSIAHLLPTIIFTVILILIICIYTGLSAMYE